MSYDCHRAFQSDDTLADHTLPDLLQRLKIFSLLHVIFAVLANRVSARTADVASCNVLAVYDHFDIVCVEDDIVFELELAVEVRYEEVYSAAAFASINNCEDYHTSFIHNGKQGTLNVKRYYLQLSLWLWHLLRLLSLV